MDAWRGYYTFEPTELERKEGWRRVTEVHAVPHGQNDDFLNTTKELLSKRYNVKAKFGRTSNVFATNLVIFAKPKAGRWSKEDKKFFEEFEDIFVSTYTSGFSIFSGETYPLDLDEYRKEVRKLFLDTFKSKAKAKLVKLE